MSRTRSERVEAAAEILCLEDREYLESALHSCGLVLVTAEQKAVLDACAKLTNEWLDCAIFCGTEPVISLAHAELARREASK